MMSVKILTRKYAIFPKWENILTFPRMFSETLDPSDVNRYLSWKSQISWDIYVDFAYHEDPQRTSPSAKSLKSPAGLLASFRSAFLSHFSIEIICVEYLEDHSLESINIS